MAEHEYILALDGLPGIESEIGEYLEYINVQTKRYMGNTIHERIVRCRDCKHFDCKPWMHYNGTVTDFNCWLFSDYEGTPVGVEPDGFCAWGERREEER